MNYPHQQLTQDQAFQQQQALMQQQRQMQQQALLQQIQQQALVQQLQQQQQQPQPQPEPPSLEAATQALVAGGEAQQGAAGEMADPEQAVLFRELARRSVTGSPPLEERPRAADKAAALAESGEGMFAKRGQPKGPKGLSHNFGGPASARSYRVGLYSAPVGAGAGPVAGAAASGAAATAATARLSQQAFNLYGQITSGTWSDTSSGGNQGKWKCKRYIAILSKRDDLVEVMKEKKRRLSQGQQQQQGQGGQQRQQGQQQAAEQEPVGFEPWEQMPGVWFSTAAFYVYTLES
jgi:hypothetical protein